MTPPSVDYPTHDYAGSSKKRQEVGLPGHCERCAQHGHVKAHPDLGCGDVGCMSSHDDQAQASLSKDKAHEVLVIGHGLDPSDVAAAFDNFPDQATYSTEDLEEIQGLAQHAADERQLDRQHAESIRREREALIMALSGSLREVATAERHLAALRGDEVYDIELVEGYEGKDVSRHLDVAARALRAAHAIVKGLPQ